MYFDPGFGSMIIQLIIAAIAAVGVVLGVMKVRMKGWFSKKKNDESTGEQVDEDEQL